MTGQRTGEKSFFAKVDRTGHTFLVIFRTGQNFVSILAKTGLATNF